MADLDERKRRDLRRVLAAGERLGLVPNMAAAERALTEAEPLAALEACGLPRALWAAIQREWCAGSSAILPVDEQVPERLSDYEVMDLLGRGGMGSVHKARDPSGRVVALKICPSLTQLSARRFQQECKAVARLRHPHIVGYIGSGAGPPPWLAMEFVEGEDLGRRLRLGPPPPEVAARLVAEVADAVAYAHSVGILHRDLKPNNVLIRPDGRAVLTDFGLTLMSDASRFTQTGRLLGTVAYMAPEQARGEEQAASDVWGLGAILYHCLTGRPPLQGGTPLEMLVSLNDPRITPAEEVCADAPPWLARLCEVCLLPEPSERPSAGALADALRAGPPPEGAPSPALTLALVGLVATALLILATLAWVLHLAPSVASTPTPRPSASLTPSAGERALQAPAQAAPPWGTSAAPLVWNLEAGGAARAPEGAWSAGGVVDPLAPAARARTLAGDVEEGENERLRVTYTLSREDVAFCSDRYDLLLSARGAMGAPLVESHPAGGVTWRDSGHRLAAVIGRSLWRSAHVALEVQPSLSSRLPLTISCGFQRMVRHGELSAGDSRVTVQFDAEGVGRIGKVIVPQRVGWRWISLQPGKEDAVRMGDEVVPLAPVYTKAAQDGAIAMEGAGHALRRARVSGVCLRPDRPARATLPRPAPLDAEFALHFARALDRDREGGPFLELGALRLELDGRALRLVHRGHTEREWVRRPAVAAREGWLRLRRSEGVVIGELWSEGRRVAALEAVDPWADPGDAAAYGSTADPMACASVELRGGQASAPAAGLRRWQVAAREFDALFDPDPRAPARPLTKLVLAPLLAELSEIGADEGLPALVRGGAWARAGLAAMVAADVASAKAAGAALRGAVGERAEALAQGASPLPVALLAEGYGYTLELDARRAGHTFVDEAFVERRGENAHGWAAMWLEVGRTHDRERRAGGTPARQAQLRRRARESFTRGLRAAKRAASLGVADALQQAELYLSLGRDREALTCLERLPRFEAFWWPLYLRASCRVRLGQAHLASIDLLLAIRRRPVRDRPHVVLLGRLLRGDSLAPVHAALCRAALAFVFAETPRAPDPNLVAKDEEERAWIAYLRLAAGEGVDVLPRGDSAVAVLARARAGDKGSLDALAEASRRDLRVLAIAGLDPVLRPHSPWPRGDD